VSSPEKKSSKKEQQLKVAKEASRVARAVFFLSITHRHRCYLINFKPSAINIVKKCSWAFVLTVNNARIVSFGA
jgi:hypothetical protein